MKGTRKYLCGRRGGRVGAADCSGRLGRGGRGGAFSAARKNRNKSDVESQRFYCRNLCSCMLDQRVTRPVKRALLRGNLTFWSENVFKTK